MIKSRKNREDGIDLDKYGALLTSKWESRGEGKIVGFWAEDFSPYAIECPKQLVDLLVDLQNELVDKRVI